MLGPLASAAVPEGEAGGAEGAAVKGAGVEADEPDGSVPLTPPRAKPEGAAPSVAEAGADPSVGEPEAGADPLVGADPDDAEPLEDAASVEGSKDLAVACRNVYENSMKK